MQPLTLNDQLSLPQAIAKVLQACPQVIVCDHADVATSAALVSALRLQHDHTPVLTLTDGNTELPAVLTANCCGGNMVRAAGTVAIAREIERLALRRHDRDC